MPGRRRRSGGRNREGRLIIGCCQAIEHYEIARFGTLRAWAKALGHEEAHGLLTGILDDHKGADHRLSSLAISTINALKK